MSLGDFRKKNYVIASDNNILFDALSDNTSYNFARHDSSADIKKIDALIIDSQYNLKPCPLFRTNIIVNLTNQPLHEKEIIVSKPLHLADLIKIISRNMEDKSLFCAINNDWIYNERRGILLSYDKEISFTDKENDLFMALLLVDNFSTNKEYLRKYVWDHSNDTESTTIETHIYKLKHKLPKDMLEIKSSGYCLNL